MTDQLHPSDPRYRQAFEESKAEFGIDLAEALLPTHYIVVLIDDRPTVCLTVDGMRALALLAPDPNAVWRTEQLISAMRKAYPAKGAS